MLPKTISTTEIWAIKINTDSNIIYSIEYGTVRLAIPQKHAKLYNKKTISNTIKIIYL